VSATRNIRHTTVATDQAATHEIASGRSWITTSAASDTDLIEGIAAGDGDAMRRLYAQHNVKVFHFALRLTRNEAMAEELVNEVFFDVWRQAGTFEGRSQVSTWLLGITRNKALAAVRRGSTEVWDDEAGLSIADTADDPETALRKKQQGSILIDCLANLTPAHREIIDLVYYHQRTIDEVAEIIHVPRNTVKTRMFYARQKLAKLLDAHGIAAALA